MHAVVQYDINLAGIFNHVAVRYYISVGSNNYATSTAPYLHFPTTPVAHTAFNAHMDHCGRDIFHHICNRLGVSIKKIRAL